MDIEGKIFYIYVLKRPGAEEFIARASEHFEVVIYTASLAKYADPLMDLLDPDGKAAFRLFREHCTFTSGVFVKDLSLLGRNLKDVIIVDNSPMAYMLQPENAVPIQTWIDDMKDKQLFQLLPIVEYLARTSDVRPAIKRLRLENGTNYAQALKMIQIFKNVARLTQASTSSQAKINTWVENAHGIIPIHIAMTKPAADVEPKPILRLVAQYPSTITSSNRDSARKDENLNGAN